MKNINKLICIILCVATLLSVLTSCDIILPQIGGLGSLLGHKCESICSECGKCTDDSCTEEVCSDKCAGHQLTPPAHTCESKCHKCGKCTDTTCKDSACNDKCLGHHTCANECPECGKCTDASCKENACSRSSVGFDRYEYGYIKSISSRIR